MIFDVMSRRDALAFAADPDILPCVIISVTDPGEEDVSFTPNMNILAVLHLKFYDTEENRPGAFTPAQAEEIVTFAEKWQGQVEEILLHCQEGVSRSAGLAAALMEQLNGNADDIWQDSRYQPNKRCYRTLRVALACRNI